jgi:hypothetical protein
MMMMPASTASGKAVKSGARKSNTIMTTIAVKIPCKGVCTPICPDYLMAIMLTVEISDERDNEGPDTWHDKKDPTCAYYGGRVIAPPDS